MQNSDYYKVEKPDFIKVEKQDDRAFTRSELAHQMYKDQERKFMGQRGVIQKPN
jgi:hypothetical protein